MKPANNEKPVKEHLHIPQNQFHPHCETSYSVDNENQLKEHLHIPLNRFIHLAMTLHDKINDKPVKGAVHSSKPNQLYHQALELLDQLKVLTRKKKVLDLLWTQELQDQLKVRKKKKVLIAVDTRMQDQLKDTRRGY